MKPLAWELAPPDLARWRAGNTGVEGVWQFDSGIAGRRLLITALVHGNELCGAWAVRDMLAWGLRPRRGVLTLALCNLAACDAFDASAPDASRFVEHDLNRVWGAGLVRGDSLEHRRARELAPFIERADWLLDLHSMHEPGPPLLLTGPLERNLDLALKLGAPEHVVVDAGHADGTRLRDHGRFGQQGEDQACALLVECGWHGHASSRAVAADLCARVLCVSGVVDEDDLPPGARQTPASPPQRALQVTHAVVARSMDTRFAQAWRSAQRIARAGTVLGWREGEPFATPYDDCTLVMPSLRQLRPGVTVVRLARTTRPN
ncbi:succinylglutamate desuccinylase [Rubrivivax sp. RP6-9]|uniref:succinylglutamate desuccinylase n=1 Tax=Rubrivivax sp. RP6-9 TaxID=3415750 RepID=UPI003CC53051